MLEIIFEDEFIIVCKKPPGIPTQTPKSGVTDMVSLLKNYRVSKGEPHYVGLVHRLDQPVEGVMVFAKDKKSAAALSAQMQAHTFEKYYYAMVDCSLVRVQLKTGRHHQIRVQLAHAGHPIIGDKKYGRNTPGYLPLGLCSYHIGFIHPVTKKKVVYEITPSGAVFQQVSYE